MLSSALAGLALAADASAGEGKRASSQRTVSPAAASEPQPRTSAQGQEQDTWTAGTVVLDSEGDDADDKAQRRVRWLDGLQRQASHLGMGHVALKQAPGKRQARGGAASSGNQPEAFAFGLHKFVRTVAVHREENAGPRSGAVSGRKAALTEWTADVKEAAAPDLGESSDEIVVIGLSAADLETARAHGFSVKGATEVGDSGTTFQRLTAPKGTTRAEAERLLYKILPSLSVMPNFTYNIYMGTPGEPETVSVLPGADKRRSTPASRRPCPSEICYANELIKWNRALSACTKDVRIGIIDTSFDIAHPSFKTLKAIHKDFLGGQSPSPADWHGTAILSVLAGDPDSGTPGLVPDATFLLATAFQTDAAGNASTDSVRLLAALAWLDELDVDIVNMSFSGPKDAAFAEAVARMSQRGVVFVAAAGNMGPTAKPSYPAAYPHVIAVTAVNRNGENYRNANRGKYIDVAAPGVDILTALPDGQQGYRTGTSFAVPYVTAILATRGRSIAFLATTEQQLLAELATQDLGAPGRDPTYGVGLVHAPERCPSDDLIARSAPQPQGEWTQRTTLVRAGAAGGLGQ